MNITFISLASGSSGNCYYLGVDNQGILIDAGIGARTIKKRLKEQGIGMENIRAVFITHDHSDHIKGVSGLGEQLHIPVYTTARIHEGIRKSYCVSPKLTDCVRLLEKETPLTVGAFTLEAFEVPHDGIDNVGYCVEVAEKVITFATDLGQITDTAARYMVQADYLIIEANYDTDMLRGGRYPLHLQERIAGPNGHLSNRATADFLSKHASSRLRHLFLCHLSQDNNRPELAVSIITDALREAGKEIEVSALKRGCPTPPFRL
jgi:phosphoribosyl 1,2-cyclic phosphodiesterase